MREFQPAGVLVAGSTYATTASTDLLHSSNESYEVRSPMSMDSHFSLLTAASSTLSIVSQTTPQCDWPEFQESYNSIMDNTNLLDSCAAALNDISTEDGVHSIRSEKIRCEFNRSLSSTTNSSFSGSDNSVVTSKTIEQFTRWLCEMENRVAAQPKLSKIVTMKPKQMASQLDVHSKIFKEIVAKPCIVKGAKRNEHKSLEERYHLLYLKVYEVLLLLEGMPANSFSPSNRILSESFHDYECSLSTNSKEHSSDHVDNGDNEFLNDVICDKIHSELKTPIYTETNVMSTSIGTYYFNYDDSCDNNQHTTDNVTPQMSSTIYESSCDREFTFEHDLHSLLDATDSLCLKSNDHTLVHTEQRPLQQELIEDTIVVSQLNHIWNQIDFCELATPSTPLPQASNSPAEEYELSHHKVYDWLHADSCQSNSTVSLDGATAGEADYQLLYRAKSEMDLSMCRPLDVHNRTSSMRTSLNCLPSILSPVKRFESTLNDSISEECSLIWDNFQLGNEFTKPDSDYGFSGSDFESKELINKLCYFGDDYSVHLNESTATESDREMENSFEEKAAKKPVMHVFETPPSTPSGSVKVRRSRRLRNKRLRSLNSTIPAYDSTSSESHSTLSLDQSSEANLSEATTASVESNMPSTLVVDDTQTVPPSSLKEFSPEKTISYNSTEKQFELHTKESNEPKKMKINEMRPEDFHDLVKMCQSNIDCVITVLGADPNRILTVAYCQQMKYERYQRSNTETCKCKQQNTDASENKQQQQKQGTKDTTQCNCSHIVANKSNEMCVCAWVSHTIAMILNFLIDCWNVFRNMKLYTYLCRVTRALFGSTRYVADHLKSKQAIANAKAIKYS
ncbi:uncharacterized protein LOC129565886 [Sitodiplosis mosellana]|uniref:uncharacterized protein LOC129565886 n=1 Tax=Sitodiplosis mosellana TaxID=263140 RepID=UPI002443BD29|nr:uncharacterized protein LOC129565886 [Sitodiplosis mosellana]